jgi:hypothetical protein
MEIEQGIAEIKPVLDSYFQSITKALDATLSAEMSRSSAYDGVFGTIGFFLLLLFSLIPALPALAYFLSRWISKPLALNVYGIHLSVHSFLFWYLALSALSAICFGIRLKYSSIRQKSGTPTINTAELLNQSQMRFALCYSVKSEIDSYRTNRLPGHIEKANMFWRQLLPSLQDALGSETDYGISSPSGMMHPEWQLTYARPISEFVNGRRRKFFPQVHKLLDRFSWFKLDPRTESVITAFDGLRSKLSGRIRDKKDLFQVSNCLLPFSLYLYTLIPDITDTEQEKENLGVFQEISLTSFVQEMASLADYTPEKRVDSKTEKSAASKAKVGGMLSATVGNTAPFLRFISIWIIVQIFVAIAISTFLAAVKTLKMDSTLVALLIGSPFAIAAALTAIPITARTEDSKVE